MKKDSSSNDSSSLSSNKKNSSGLKKKITPKNKRRFFKHLKITQLIFSEREKTVIYYIMKGKSLEEIQALLGITQNTCYFTTSIFKTPSVFESDFDRPIFGALKS